MIEQVVAWSPLIIVVVAVAITGRMSMKSYSDHVARVEAINQDLVKMNSEMVAELREIKHILKDRK